MAKKKTFIITGMHCTACAMDIDFQLEDLEGVKKAVTNYARQRTEVEFEEGQVTEFKIIEVIKSVGYTAIPHNEQ